ncbi:8535_t:CDS:2, partial [Gigaspora margarita]
MNLGQSIRIWISTIASGLDIKSFDSGKREAQKHNTGEMNKFDTTLTIDMTLTIDAIIQLISIGRDKRYTTSSYDF